MKVRIRPFQAPVGGRRPPNDGTDPEPARRQRAELRDLGRAHTRIAKGFLQRVLAEGAPVSGRDEHDQPSMSPESSIKGAALRGSLARPCCAAQQAHPRLGTDWFVIMVEGHHLRKPPTSANTHIDRQTGTRFSPSSGHLRYEPHLRWSPPRKTG
jgi:hypothetical protein